jgi:hypothetical protein
MKMQDTRRNSDIIPSVKSMVIEGRKKGLSDNDIDVKIFETYGRLDYGVCFAVDRDIFGCRGHGYWRLAFGYPNNGDEVQIEALGKCRVMRSGFFTFEIETEYERIFDEQFLKEMMLVQD